VVIGFLTHVGSLPELNLGAEFKLEIKKVYGHNSYLRMILTSCIVLSVLSCISFPQHDESVEYSRLVEFIRLEDKNEPLYAFNDFEEKFDRECHEASLDYLNQNPNIVEKIKSDLHSDKLKWKMLSLKRRLVFVPESRKEYAELYRDYCQAVIDFILTETKLNNPYLGIMTLDRDVPEIPSTSNGVTVFLVHNLAKEYIGTYLFFNETQKKKVNLSLSGTVFTGEIGSYSSMLHLTKDGRLEFVHNRFTIWQNSANSTFNTLILPIEETLHITLRPYTEAAIEAQVDEVGAKTSQVIRDIAAQWIEVEEALAGGLTHYYFPRVADKFFQNYELSEMNRSLEQKVRLQKYKYLKKGIRIVDRLGSEAVLKIYRSDPKKFRELLEANNKV
jgi:hypothetical protein